MSSKITDCTSADAAKFRGILRNSAEVLVWAAASNRKRELVVYEVTA